MTAAQIVWQIIIGLFLLVMGSVLGTLFKKMWARMQRPTPLSPQDKGRLVEQIAMQEYELEKLNHFVAHPKDLFLFLFQLLIYVLLSFVASFVIYATPTLLGKFRYPDLTLMLLCGVLLCVACILLARYYSDKRIDANRRVIEKRIDEAKSKLGDILR